MRSKVIANFALLPEWMITCQSLYVLTIVTVLALPINILAGLFGMNVGGVPLAQHPSGFWVVVMIVLTFTLVAAWAVFFRRRDK